MCRDTHTPDLTLLLFSPVTHALMATHKTHDIMDQLLEIVQQYTDFKRVNTICLQQTRWPQ